MKATETYLILCQMDAGEITLQEAHELILRLFGVMESLPQDNFCKVCNLPTDGEKCYSKRCPV